MTLLELEPMTKMCKIGREGDNQEIKVAQNLQQVEPNCAMCTPIRTPYNKDIFLGLPSLRGHMQRKKHVSSSKRPRDGAMSGKVRTG